MNWNASFRMYEYLKKKNNCCFKQLYIDIEIC